MSSAMNQSCLLTRLRDLHPDCTLRSLDGARWGTLILPRDAAPGPPAAADPLRVMLFGSFWIGHAALQAALAFAARQPQRVELVGVVTDDAVSPQARISLRKRAWGLMTETERAKVMLGLIGTALDSDIPVYTGEIKTPGFRALLAERKPDAILTCGFGQVLDGSILNALPYGAYNCHPTDLANGHGAGPAPWTDMAARGVRHTVWTVHQMTEGVDDGPVIGQTPPINVGDAKGCLPNDARAFFFKVLPPIGWMVLSVLEALAQRRERGERGALSRVDIAGTMPPGLRRRLLLPLAPDWEAAPIPCPGEEEFAALARLSEPAMLAAAEG